MMEAWKAVRTRASVTGRSSAAPERFVSALPSRSDGSARETLRNRLAPLEGGEGFGGRIDYAASGRARSVASRVVSFARIVRSALGLTRARPRTRRGRHGH